MQAVSRNQLRSALERCIADASDTLKAVFDLALKQQRQRTFDNASLILSALTTIGDRGGTHGQILQEVRKTEESYPAGNLTTYLRELQSSSRGEILRYDSVSGRYFFSDPLYLAYSQCFFNKPGKRAATIKIMDFDFKVSGKFENLLIGTLKHWEHHGRSVTGPTTDAE